MGSDTRIECTRPDGTGTKVLAHTHSQGDYHPSRKNHPLLPYATRYAIVQVRVPSLTFCQILYSGRRLSGGKSLKRVIIEYLNLLLGKSNASTRYWNHELSQTVRMSFFYHNTTLPVGFMEVMKDQVRFAQPRYPL